MLETVVKHALSWQGNFSRLTLVFRSLYEINIDFKFRNLRLIKSFSFNSCTKDNNKTFSKKGVSLTNIHKLFRNPKARDTPYLSSLQFYNHPNKIPEATASALPIFDLPCKFRDNVFGKTCCLRNFSYHTGIPGIWIHDVVSRSSGIQAELVW